jgi:hypothetical protein
LLFEVELKRLVLKVPGLFASLNSRLESNQEEKKRNSKGRCKANPA